MTRNREQDVIDAIDALVDEQMAGGEHAHQERAQATGTSDRCTLCHGAWHGDPWTGVDHEHLGQYDQHHHGRTLGCPGANATGPQRIRWRHNRNHHHWPYTDMVTSTAWNVDLINAMRPPVPPWRQLLLNSIAATRGDIQLPNRPAFNPADWGLPPQPPYIEVASEPYIDRVNALRSPPNPLLPQPSSPWIIQHTSEGADPGEMVAVDIETLRSDNVFQTLPVQWHAHKGSRDKLRGEVVTFGLPSEAVEGLLPGRVIGVDPLTKCYGFYDAWLVAIKLGADPTVATSVAWTILQAAAVSRVRGIPPITAWGALERDPSSAPEFLVHVNTHAVIPTSESMWAAARPVLMPWLRAYQAAKVDCVVSPVEKSTKLTVNARSIPGYWRRGSLIIYDNRSLPAVPDVFAMDENNSVLVIRPDGFTIHSPRDPDVSAAVKWMPTGEETRALVRDSIGQWHAVHLPQPDMLERA